VTRRWLLAFVLGLAPVVEAQTRVTLRDLGPGAAGRILRSALERPHRLVEPDSGPFTQRRGEVLQSTLIVLDRTAYIGGKVEGDVIVVNGDLFVRPGAEITGRAVAIGAGVYPSTLGFVGGGTQSFRDDGFVIEHRADAYELTYRSLREGATPPLLFPGVYGLRIPSYDRVNGLSVPFGPALTLAGGRVEINGIATYRSDLGKVDPMVDVDFQMTRRVRMEARAERGSFTNERWIYPDLINSGASLVFGEDTRNWYRADRGELTIHRLWEMTRATLEPFVGVRTEKSWPVGPAPGATSGPWSILGRDDTLAMLRPNPQVGRENLRSALVGTSYRWEGEGLTVKARTALELGTGPRTIDDIRTTWAFSQLISDLDVRFPTFGEQSYQMEVHWVTSGGDGLPAQRAHYLGGPGTMPFLEILEQGGGELLLVDQRYSIPLPRYTFGFMGSPTLQLRHRLGSAGQEGPAPWQQGLPPLEQMIGVGVSLTVIRGEVRLDPASGRTQFALGFTFAR
jgi:hypothetical protein